MLSGFLSALPLGFFVALGAAVLVVVLGLVAEALVRHRRVRGYPEIAGAILALAKALRGEVDRDGNDILLRVNVQQWPVLVRVSSSDGEPGLNVRTPVEAKLGLYCVARSKTDGPHPEALFTGNVQFDNRFRVTMSDPFLGSMLLQTEPVLTLLQRLCCSPKTFLSMEDKYLEISELTIPDRDLAAHVSEHISDLARLAHITRTVAGTSASHIKPYHKRRNWLRTVYAAAAVVLVGVGLWIGRPAGPVKAAEVHSSIVRPQIPAADAALIPNLDNFRLLESGDCSVDALAYLEQQGLRPDGHIAASFSGTDTGSAYVLINKQSEGPTVRVVLIVGQQVRYDASMAHLDVAARIPKSQLTGIEWKGRPPLGEPNGDGLLLVRDYANPGSGTVLYFSGVRLISANPKDFHAIALQ